MDMRERDSVASSRTVFITSKCNNNCVMCPMSEVSRRAPEDPAHHKRLMEEIASWPADVAHIDITGGEPTLRPAELLDTLALLSSRFQHTDFQLLTNGRSLSNVPYLEAIRSVLPTGTRLGIPLHASYPELFDGITSVSGSFRQTLIGVENALANELVVEIRVVVSRLNLRDLPEIAGLVAERFPTVSKVDLMGLEMMGSALKNRREVWVDYKDSFSYVSEAIDILVAHGVDAEIYNFPLCAVQKEYRSLCRRSISDYKVSFGRACDFCSLKSACGGIFFSTLRTCAVQLRPERCDD